LIVKAINEELKSSQDAFKIYSFSGRPDQVMQAVELGFDIFTGSYPYLETQKGHACMYDYKMPNDINSDSDDEQENVPIKKRKIEDLSKNDTFIDLNDKK
jgi:hypothetical protein